MVVSSQAKLVTPRLENTVANFILVAVVSLRSQYRYWDGQQGIPKHHEYDDLTAKLQ